VESAAKNTVAKTVVAEIAARRHSSVILLVKLNVVAIAVITPPTKPIVMMVNCSF